MTKKEAGELVIPVEVLPLLRVSTFLCSQGFIAPQLPRGHSLKRLHWILAFTAGALRHSCREFLRNDWATEHLYVTPRMGLPANGARMKDCCPILRKKVGQLSSRPPPLHTLENYSACHNWFNSVYTLAIRLYFGDLYSTANGAKAYCHNSLLAWTILAAICKWVWISNFQTEISSTQGESRGRFGRGSTTGLRKYSTIYFSLTYLKRT